MWWKCFSEVYSVYIYIYIVSRLKECVQSDVGIVMKYSPACCTPAAAGILNVHVFTTGIRRFRDFSDIIDVLSSEQVVCVGIIGAGYCWCLWYGCLLMYSCPPSGVSDRGSRWNWIQPGLHQTRSWAAGRGLFSLPSCLSPGMTPADGIMAVDHYC